MEPIKLFIGWDDREAVGGHVFIESLRRTTRHPVSLTLITKELAADLGVGTDGTNAFSISRFLVPYLCNFRGHAIYLDGTDMLLRADLKELWELRDGHVGVQVVKHDYQTKHPKKYIGTPLETSNVDYLNKNWSSVILWNCEYFPHRHALEPKAIVQAPSWSLHRFQWMKDEAVDDLPAEWNHLVGEFDPNPEAKIAHFTLGIPGFEHYRRCEHAQEWNETLQRAARGFRFFGNHLNG